MVDVTTIATMHDQKVIDRLRAENQRLRNALSAAPPPGEWTAEEYDAWWDNTRHPALHNL